MFCNERERGIGRHADCFNNIESTWENIFWKVFCNEIGIGVGVGVGVGIGIDSKWEK